MYSAHRSKVREVSNVKVTCNPYTGPQLQLVDSGDRVHKAFFSNAPGNRGRGEITPLAIGTETRATVTAEGTLDQVLVFIGIVCPREIRHQSPFRCCLSG